MDDPTDCTGISLSFPRWNIYDPSIRLIKNSTTGTVGDYQFAALNVATGEQTTCRVRDVELEPKGDSSTLPWYNCTSAGTQFRFNLEGFVLNIRSSWVCDNSPELVSAFLSLIFPIQMCTPEDLVTY
jgi:hypothetical protein